jgi:glycosyltransferase involved in cell wall biosynthesis
MKIALASSWTPFATSETDLLAEALGARLRSRGHRVMRVRLPYQSNGPEAVLSHMLAWRLSRLEHVDRLVALDFPSYLLEHPNKVVWLTRRHRLTRADPADAEEVKLRHHILSAEHLCLSRAKVFTSSRRASDGLERTLHLTSELLLPPRRDATPMPGPPPEAFVYVPAGRRDALVLEALQRAGSVTAVVADARAARAEPRRLQALVDERGLSSRVRVIDHPLAPAERADLVARARVVLDATDEEDYDGDVVVEAFEAGRPVVVCADGGAAADLVSDRRTGRVVEPSAPGIAEALESLVGDATTAASYGARGRLRLAELEVRWDRVVERLTS